MIFRSLRLSKGNALKSGVGILGSRFAAIGGSDLLSAFITSSHNTRRSAEPTTSRPIFCKRSRSATLVVSADFIAPLCAETPSAVVIAVFHVTPVASLFSTLTSHQRLYQNA